MDETKDKIISIIENEPGISREKLVSIFGDQEDFTTVIENLAKSSIIKIVKYNGSELLYPVSFSNTQRVEQQVKTDESFSIRDKTPRALGLVIIMIIGILAVLICFTNYLDGIFYFGIILLIAFLIFKWVFS